MQAAGPAASVWHAPPWSSGQSAQAWAQQSDVLSWAAFPSPGPAAGVQLWRGQPRQAAGRQPQRPKHLRACGLQQGFFVRLRLQLRTRRRTVAARHCFPLHSWRQQGLPSCWLTGRGQSRRRAPVQHRRPME